MALTPRQARFVDEYLVDLNATQAARRAGYSAKTANEQGSQLLANLSVQAAVQAAKAERAKRTEITQDAVLQELAKIGFANMLDFVKLTDGGDAYVDLSNLTREQAAAIGEIVVEDFKDGRGEDARDVRRVKFKLVDKLGALAKVGDHLGMFNKSKVELTGKDGGPVQVTDSEAAAKIAAIMEAARRRKDEAGA